MKERRKLNLTAMLEAAKAGNLSGSALRKAIKIAEDLGKVAIAKEMRLYLVQSASFAGDAAPARIRDRVAQGVSALMAMGEPLHRTKKMLRTHGVIGTLNRIARYPNATKNFDKLRAANLEHLTAEAIVLDDPDLFDPKAVDVARKRLGR